MSSPNNVYQLISRTTNCRLYSNISQILLLYIKYGGIIKNLTPWNPWGVFYWYVKMPRFGGVEHGLKYVMFYVQKHIAYLAACSGPHWFMTGIKGSPHLWNSHIGLDFLSILRKVNLQPGTRAFVILIRRKEFKDDLTSVVPIFPSRAKSDKDWSLWCSKWNIPDTLGQYPGCWWPGSLNH